MKRGYVKSRKLTRKQRREKETHRVEERRRGMDRVKIKIEKLKIHFWPSIRDIGIVSN